ncbi:nonsense-mediated mRNA decay factor SMG7-like [Rhodamnia argentea]|uniref:Nonsense-mediated mRNA decay factor SMG7-like n=1 Tax=Rhodamnia argentea TaxID=178133 RepID=A0A8B8Q8U1_9MYRT|nr:nonsense-mediated mRNA decay factor SMG7-like [Rhodamnia argentea]XP_030543546.2 nonsense-mediated mRNA decay factor SMG7-like [Rhodamnia argentea]XP_030543547.2 nonsense-mediated mRNA decay factor SMG7-like [Rhodamnia argentea]XP_030543548.2 nonsense-mediated mRNA decay factor SMG7-like [Rhodamnia argentea]XP_048132404.1 nonsense-mediated mRNA decay factor SMG7-like [Rhodamnia argentea]
MDARPSVHQKDQTQTENSLAEVSNTEKLLWASINSRGLLHSDVKHLYQQVCSVLKKSILKDSEQADFQDIEYSLWKLHYKHIDEFRKQIKKVSSCTNSEVPQNVINAQRSADDYSEGIKLFLSEATNFYKSLIVKVQRCHGIPEDTLFHRNSGIINNVDQKRIKNCQFLCHRFLICLGDLARYRVLYERPDNQNRNWSIAAAHYLEALTIWPDSGNPHNQLALLSTYVGDEFLALYHCIRSLAVKEPFPDAWNNLILLLEKSRLSLLHSHSAEASFDFFMPSERRKVPTKLQSGDDVTNCNISTEERGCLVGKNLWHLFVIVISFFYVRSSLDDFLRAFSSTKGELEALLDLDDIHLEGALRTYQFMDPTRTGPFRAVQAICVFIFVIQNLPKSPVMTNLEDKKEMPPLLSRDHAVMALFTIVNQLVDRVVKASPWDSCPLLPAILVFVEWLANLPEEEDLCGTNEMSEAAFSSFCKSFICLVNLMHSHVGEVKSQDCALWEDYELRGFAPSAHAHLLLDFSSHRENSTDYRSGKVCRARRIIDAAMRIAETSGRHNRWIQYDKLRRQFYELESNGSQEKKCSESTLGTHPKLKISLARTSEVIDERRNAVLRESPRRSVAEEEEVILFKPLTRHNSAPLHKYISKKGDPHKELMDQSAPPDECLRRATSLLIAQNPVHSEPSNFQPNTNSFRHNEPFMQQQQQPPPFFSDMANLFPATPISTGAGPPSLNAWVLNRGSSNMDKEKGTDLGKRHLPPIEEIASESLADLSINKITEPQNPVIGSCHESVITHYPSPPYSTPVPSAPLLPDDAVWFGGVNTSSFSDHKTNETIGVMENFLTTSPGKSYSDYAVPLAPNASSLGVTGFNYVYPIQCGMSSSEWLRQFREINNLHQGNHGQMLSPSVHGPGNIGNIYHLGVPQVDPFNSWGTPSFSNQTVYSNHQAVTPGYPAFYGVDEPKDRVFHAYYRASPYGCGAGTAELRDDQQMLLQYLKEREWRLQQDPDLRGPTF